MESIVGVLLHSERCKICTHWLTDSLIVAAHLSSERHRRNAEFQESLSCPNGSIIPPESSSTLKGPPKADIKGYQKNAWLNEYASFTCLVSSNLSATVSWLFNGKTLVPVKNRHSYHDCKTVLLIKKVLSKDTGNYTCVVRNRVGQAMASSHLSVKCKFIGLSV